MIARLPRIDPRGPLLTAAALVVFLLHGFEGWLSRDSALYAYAGQQCADGVPPYLGVLNRSGPLAHAIPGLGAVGARLVGADELLGMRVLTMLICCASVWLGYLLGRDMFGTPLAGLVTGTSLLTLNGFVDLATSGPRDKIVVVAFMLAAVWATSRRWWAAAGAAVACATLTWQPAFFPSAAVVILAAALVSTRRGRLRALAGFVLGGLAVLALTVLAFLAVGALTEFYEGFIGIHAGGYTTQQGLLSKTHAKLVNLAVGYGWGVVVLAAGTLGALGLAAARLRDLDRADAGQVTTVALALGPVTCLAWSLTAYQRWTDALFLVPFAAAGVGGLAHVAASTLRRDVAARAGAAVVVVALVASGASSWLGRSTALETQRALAPAMLAAAGPGATLQTFGTTEPLVFTGRRNPVRYINFGKGLGAYLDETLPGGLTGLAADVGRRRPDVIVVEKYRGPGFAWLRPVLRQHHVLLGGDETSFFWFADRSLGEERHDAMRDELRAAGVPIEPGP